MTVKRHLTLCSQNPDNAKTTCPFCSKLYRIKSSHLQICNKNPDNICPLCLMRYNRLHEDAVHICNWYQSDENGDETEITLPRLSLPPRDSSSMFCPRLDTERALEVISHSLKEESWEYIELIDSLTGSTEERLNSIVKHMDCCDLDDLIDRLDLQCIICYHFTENVLQPCKHRACLRCTQKLKSLGYSCPMCRGEIY